MSRFTTALKSMGGILAMIAIMAVMLIVAGLFGDLLQKFVNPCDPHIVGAKKLAFAACFFLFLRFSPVFYSEKRSVRQAS